MLNSALLSATRIHCRPDFVATLDTHWLPFQLFHSTHHRTWSPFAEQIEALPWVTIWYCSQSFIHSEIDVAQRMLHSTFASKSVSVTIFFTTHCPFLLENSSFGSNPMSRATPCEPSILRQSASLENSSSYHLQQGPFVNFERLVAPCLLHTSSRDL